MDAPPATLPVIPPPPTPALPQRKTPFASHAAKASLFAPFLAVGLVIVVTVGMMVETVLTKGVFDPSPAALRITLAITVAAFILFTICGLIFGIFSMFCIPRYGKKGILGYAIAGIVLNGLPWVLLITKSIMDATKYMNSTP